MPRSLEQLVRAVQSSRLLNRWLPSDCISQCQISLYRCKFNDLGLYGVHHNAKIDAC